MFKAKKITCLKRTKDFNAHLLFFSCLSLLDPQVQRTTRISWEHHMFRVPSLQTETPRIGYSGMGLYSDDDEKDMESYGDNNGSSLEKVL